MVFFTSILIVCILYYLQADGLIYVTILALVGELANIFMTHTVTKSVEKRLTTLHKRIVTGYTNRLKANRKTIQALEKVQEDSVRILYNANMKIKELEEQLAPFQTPPEEKQTPPPKKQTVLPVEETKKPDQYMDLPDGSNRNRP